MTKYQNLLRPSTYLIQANKACPEAWTKIDAYIQQHNTNWPKWCFIPGNANYLDSLREGGSTSPQPQIELAYLAAWRATQGVYAFDRDVIEEVWNTSIEGDIPTDVLHFLPEWCVYVETGSQDFSLGILHGFFACLDFHLGESSETSESIVILLDIELKTGSSSLVPLMFPTKIGSGVSPTIEELIAIYMNEQGNAYFPADHGLWGSDELRETVQTSLNNLLPRIFSLLLYICSVNAEFKDGAGKCETPKHATPRTTKGKQRFFPPANPTVWETAWRVGAAIRSFKTKRDSSNVSLVLEKKRPHIRRAHWHSFWVGPRNGEKNVRIKWLPPIQVNVDSAEDLIPAVRGVD